MVKKYNILAVDDDSINLDIIESIFVDEDEFNLIKFDAGLTCINYLEDCLKNNETLPYIILLDTNMPGISGLEVCNNLKKDPNFSDIKIIIVSGNIAVENHIAAYEAGADDYFDKPFNTDELLIKVRKLIELRSQELDKTHNLSDAMSTAMTAMTNASEIGFVLRFVQDLYVLNTEQGVAEAILNACKNYNLSVIVTVNIGLHNEIAISNKGEVKPLETELIKQVKERERIFHFGKRTIFSYGEVSLLVLNMPLDNEDLYGRLKDHLAIIVEGAESRVKAITAELQRDEQRQQLISLVGIVRELMESLEHNQKTHQIEHTELMNDLLDQVEESFVFLALTDEQENRLSSVIKETERKATILFDKGADLQEKLVSIKMMLEHTIA